MFEINEEFTESQLKILDHFVSSTSSNVFVLRNLPEVIKGALFSRYSRSTLGLRALLLKEFILNEEMAFGAIAGKRQEGEGAEEQAVAIQKAQNFYDRILDGYGDDSIGELGGAHLALEGISMIAAKAIEDCRIGGSPLEKSTRYIYFDQKVNGEYQFYQEPVLLTSAYRSLYLETCNHLFETYSKLIPPLTALIERGFPKEPAISKGAYTAALRAKVLDCLRGLLPAAAMTNMGVFGNGRFYENWLQKMNGSNLAELQEVGKKAYQELHKVIPSFIRRADPANKHYQAFTDCAEAIKRALKAQKRPFSPATGASVRLISYDPHSVYDVAAALLFADGHADLSSLQGACQSLSIAQIEELFRSLAAPRSNRRHKSPRALEQASFTFEIVADFGAYRDLHRHRMVSQERQLLSCHHGYYIPAEILGTELEAPYRDAMDRSKTAFEAIEKEFPEEAQYVVPMAYNVRWYFHLNLRALQWLAELRSQPAGHPTYRLIAQEMARQVTQAIPPFAHFFGFVDFGGYQLGRLGAEIRQEEKLLNRS